jgi:hypothetical protein
MKAVRGSRKHILDWVGRTTFPEELSALVRPTGATVTERHRWMPRGRDRSTRARLERFGPHALPAVVEWEALRSWWVAHDGRASTPAWDLVATCDLRGGPGLILIEPRINTSELTSDGKELRGRPSWRSRENHARIRNAIEEARRGLNAEVLGVRIRAGSHYRLSSRVAFAWRLASLGLETVLVYLGLTGHAGEAETDQRFRDHDHWLSAFSAHARAVLPDQFFERRLECGSAGMQVIVRSLALEPGGPRLPG